MFVLWTIQYEKIDCICRTFRDFFHLMFNGTIVMFKVYVYKHICFISYVGNYWWKLVLKDLVVVESEKKYLVFVTSDACCI